MDDPSLPDAPGSALRASTWPASRRAARSRAAGLDALRARLAAPMPDAAERCRATGAALAPARRAPRRARRRLAARRRAAPPRSTATSREAVAALDTIEPGDRLVVFVGKLIASKGVELLLAAFPLVLAREPRARLMIVGFGAFRPGLERLAAALAAGDLEAAAQTRAEDGRELPAAAAFLSRGRRRVPRRRRGPARPRRVGGPARPRRARRPAARRRGDGGHEHVPGGVRHGRRRGRRLRRAAGRRQPLRARRGRAHAAPRPSRPRRATGSPSRSSRRRGAAARRRALGLARRAGRPPRRHPRGDRRGHPRPLLVGRRRRARSSPPPRASSPTSPSRPEVPGGGGQGDRGERRRRTT